MRRHHAVRRLASLAALALGAPLLAALPASPTAAAPTWTAVGPSTVAWDVATAPSNPDVVYAATDAGVLRSADGGRTWSPSGTAEARAVAVSLTDPDVVYAVTWPDGQVIRSGDAGSTWEAELGAGQARDLTVTADRVVVVGDPNNVTYTENGGWSAHNEIEGADVPGGEPKYWGKASQAYAIAATDGVANSSPPPTFYVALTRGLVQWGSAGFVLMPVGAPRAIDVTADGGTVLAGSWISTDSGNGWSNYALDMPVTAAEIDRAATPLRMYVGTAALAGRSSVHVFNGTGWTALGLTGLTVNGLDAHNGRLLAATSTGIQLYAELAPPGSVTASVTGGETVSTGSVATPDVPVQTTIVVPAGVAGTVSVTPEPPGTSPSGFSLLGSQLKLEGPATTAAAPYRLTFVLDASTLGTVTPSDVQVFRNGVPLATCTDPVAAFPDPCVESRAVGTGGDAVIVVRTSHFSTWNLGRAVYDLLGPRAPVAPMPTINAVKAGSAVPVKFTLGGDRGLDVLAAGYPQVRAAACGSSPTDAVAATSASGNSSLTFADGVYTYTWKTSKTSAGCRDLVLRFHDGSELSARFQLR